MMDQLVGGLLKILRLRLWKVIAHDGSISHRATRARALHYPLARRDSGRGRIVVAEYLPVVRIGECEFPAPKLLESAGRAARGARRRRAGRQRARLTAQLRQLGD